MAGWHIFMYVVSTGDNCFAPERHHDATSADTTCIPLSRTRHSPRKYTYAKNKCNRFCTTPMREAKVNAQFLTSPPNLVEKKRNFACMKFRRAGRGGRFLERRIWRSSASNTHAGRSPSAGP
eukprot:2669809-Pyramimonas_sp.AAC.1